MGLPYFLSVAGLSLCRGNWFKNARAAEFVTLSQGGKDEARKIIPAAPKETALVRKSKGIVRSYFDVRQDSPIEDFIAEAQHLYLV